MLTPLLLRNWEGNTDRYLFEAVDAELIDPVYLGHHLNPRALIPSEACRMATALRSPMARPGYGKFTVTI